LPEKYIDHIIPKISFNQEKPMEFRYLFSPIRINKTEIKNRIVMTAMHLGYTPEGVVTDRLVEFYRMRAKGGVGLIIVGGCTIDEYAGMASMIGLSDDKFIPGLKRLCETVKAEGAKVAAQLYQAGRYTHSAMIGGKKPFSASAVRSKLTGEVPRALELEEIPMVQDSFAKAAKRAKEAGFDAVEILGSAGYLISQFFSPITNLRTDRYGGSLENRMRFGIEVVQRVRDAVGPDYPIIMRLAGNEFMEGGNTNKEARIFAKELEMAGVDLFNITGGWHETRVPQLTMFVPRAGFSYLASNIKKAVQVPVIASNRINDPYLGEEILVRGEADMITMARALIADPDLPKKAMEGKAHMINHCIACNQGCFDNIFSFRPVTCLVNPLAGRESELEVRPADQKKKVVVVGGGPAGLKCGITLKERGHEVVLLESSGSLGGQLLLNQKIPGRMEMVTLALDLCNQAKALGLDIRLNAPATLETILREKPDAVVVATGARPHTPQILGVDLTHVHQAWEVLKGKVMLQEPVVIIGGNAVGLETALYVASHGTLSPEDLFFLFTNKAEEVQDLWEYCSTGNKKVVVLEMLPKAGKDIGQSTRWTVFAELKRLNVQILTNTKAVEIKEGEVIALKDEEELTIKAGSVVLATGSIPQNQLYGELLGHNLEVYLIGDAQKIGKAIDAIREGFELALRI